jgi:hypothetical protein
MVGRAPRLRQRYGGQAGRAESFDHDFEQKHEHE